MVSRSRSIRRTSPATIASASGRSRVTRRWSLALPAARTAHTASLSPACMTPSTTSLYPPSPLTETSSERPEPAASLARSRACPAYWVGQSSTGTAGSLRVSSARSSSADRGASPVLFGLKMITIRSYGLTVELLQGAGARRLYTVMPEGRPGHSRGRGTPHCRSTAVRPVPQGPRPAGPGPSTNALGAGGGGGTRADEAAPHAHRERSCMAVYGHAL